MRDAGGMGGFVVEHVWPIDSVRHRRASALFDAATCVRCVFLWRRRSGAGAVAWRPSAFIRRRKEGDE